MSWSSTAPAALAALHLAATSLESDTVGVYDGPNVSGTAKRAAIIVGYESDTSAAIEHQFDFASAAVSPTRETYVINNHIIAVKGGNDIAGARVLAYQILGQFGELLAQDPFLGGVVMSCRISDASLTQAQTKRGAEVALSVAVTVQATSNH